MSRRTSDITRRALNRSRDLSVEPFVDRNSLNARVKAEASERKLVELANVSTRMRLPRLCCHTLFISCVFIWDYVITDSLASIYAASPAEVEVEVGDDTQEAVDFARFDQPFHEPPHIRFLKSDVIDNIECRLSSGFGAARDVGVVTVPRGEVTDFAVLSPSGTRFSGSLPFEPNWVRIGVSPDGSTVVGFADLRGGGGEFKPPDAPEPIRILRDNQTIYESEKVWNFDVAADAHSFIVHEPDSDGTSTLIVQNLTTDDEFRYDLGTRFTPVNAYERDDWLQYSRDFKEAVFVPAHADSWGVGRHWFYPISEGTRRRITVESVLSAVSMNSEEWYFVEYPDRSLLKNVRIAWPVVRKQLDPVTNEEKVIWKRMVELDHFNGSMELSRNGKWLGLSAWNYVVMNTETGETQFQFQTVHDKQEQFARLRPVLPVDATVSDMGSIGSARFLHNYLLLHSKRGDATACSRDRLNPYNQTTYRTCLREQRRQNKYRWFHYAFDLNTVSIDGSPSFRREWFRDTSILSRTQVTWTSCDQWHIDVRTWWLIQLLN